LSPTLTTPLQVVVVVVVVVVGIVDDGVNNGRDRPRRDRRLK
jgi:hypothetical protein